MRECYQVMPLELEVSMCSRVRSKSMAQCRTCLLFPRATARNRADKRKRVFTIAGDARQDRRIQVNKVARVTLWHILER
jgi:hypothetical protein